jgi:hypothetical protein
MPMFVTDDDVVCGLVFHSLQSRRTGDFLMWFPSDANTPSSSGLQTGARTFIRQRQEATQYLLVSYTVPQGKRQASYAPLGGELASVFVEQLSFPGNVVTGMAFHCPDDSMPVAS